MALYKLVNMYILYIYSLYIVYTYKVYILVYIALYTITGIKHFCLLMGMIQIRVDN